ncbi:hypothetical protein L1049_021036 [Liquidambar formosana]|uniref:Uncharacterized protein n=1 Tax=Liquidambar formosana TaxID=63359 RepID=A0AAP0SA18_LIQFO
MATQMGSRIQDQNLNVHYKGSSVGGKTNVSKAQKKGGLGGRKPLSELSNSANPSANLASKKNTSMNFTYNNEEIGASKSTYSVGGKKTISKAPEKAQTACRKPLGDISNSGKPCLHQASKKNHNNNLNAVVEDQLYPSAIAEEQFLHNHQECIKAHRKAVDIDYFLKTIGLDNDSSMLSSLPVIPMLRKLKPKSPSRYLELDDEMAELPVEDQSPPCRKTELLGEYKSSPPCKTPKSPSYTSTGRTTIILISC